MAEPNIATVTQRRPNRPRTDPICRDSFGLHYVLFIYSTCLVLGEDKEEDPIILIFQRSSLVVLVRELTKAFFNAMTQETQNKRVTPEYLSK